MTTICPFNRATRTKTAVSPVKSTDPEVELAAILAAAERAFDQVSLGRQDIAA